MGGWDAWGGRCPLPSRECPVQIRDYWVIFSKRWWLIVLVAAVACVSSYVYAKLQTPIYRSEVQLTVAPSRLDYGLTLVIDNMLTQYQEQLLTRGLAQQVDDALQLDLPPQTLLSKVNVGAVSNGYLLDITVDDTDPTRAQDIAREWAQLFIEQHQAEMAPLDPADRIEVALLDKPLPGTLFFPRTKQYVVAAGVLGLVVGALLAFLLEYLDDTLKTSEDVERFISLPVIGSVPTFTELTPPAAKAQSNGHVKTGLIGGRR
jgi:capsular polysaccharide biosynthesis protein